MGCSHSRRYDDVQPASEVRISIGALTDQITSTANQITLPANQATVLTNQITNPASQITVPTSQITDPTNQITVPANQITVFTNLIAEAVEKSVDATRTVVSNTGETAVTELIVAETGKIHTAISQIRAESGLNTSNLNAAIQQLTCSKNVIIDAASTFTAGVILHDDDPITIATVNIVTAGLQIIEASNQLTTVINLDTTPNGPSPLQSEPEAPLQSAARQITEASNQSATLINFDTTLNGPSHLQSESEAPLESAARQITEASRQSTNINNLEAYCASIGLAPNQSEFATRRNTSTQAEEDEQDKDKDQLFKVMMDIGTAIKDNVKGLTDFRGQAVACCNYGLATLGLTFAAITAKDSKLLSQYPLVFQTLVLLALLCLLGVWSAANDYFNASLRIKVDKATHKDLMKTLNISKAVAIDSKFCSLSRDCLFVGLIICIHVVVVVIVKANLSLF